MLRSELFSVANEAVAEPLQTLAGRDMALLVLVGMGIVMAVLAVILLYTRLQSAVLGKMKPAVEQKVAAAPAPAAPAAAPAPQAVAAPHTIALVDVEDRDAAMIMAIVAEQCEIPLNRLRFLSIRKIDKA